MGGYSPPVAGNMTGVTYGMAGGGAPTNYGWGDTISSNGTDFLQILLFLDNILAAILFDGYDSLNQGGKWSGTYPKAIVDTMGSMAAQAQVHRYAVTDSLSHYKKDYPMSTCKYKLPDDSVDDFLSGLLAVLLLSIGLLLDVIGQVATTDAWMVPALGTEIGAKARMTGVINMMQGHMAAAAPREAMMPPGLAYAYASQHWIDTCPDEVKKALPSGWTGRGIPSITVEDTQMVGMTSRMASVTMSVPGDAKIDGGAWMAWIGAWGSMQFTSVTAQNGRNFTAEVPKDMYGHLWGVLVPTNQIKLQGLYDVALAGPVLIWAAGVRDGM